MKFGAIMLVLMSPLSGALADNGIYQNRSAFLDDVFDGNTPESLVLWQTAAVRQTVRSILGHDYPGLRIRYWRNGEQTAWILDEIGKEKPITVGFLVNDGQLELVRVLAFRESRGWEVRHPFFTNQFLHARLDNKRQLDRHIDGITGATLSVRALRKLARLALYLHARSETANAD